MSLKTPALYSRHFSMSKSYEFWFEVLGLISLPLT